MKRVLNTDCIRKTCMHLHQDLHITNIWLIINQSDNNKIQIKITLKFSHSILFAK